MKPEKYYVSVSGYKGEGGLDKTNFYQSKDFVDKEKAIMDFALRQSKAITLDYPFSDYDEVWVYLYKITELESVVLYFTLIDINALKADYKIEGRCDIID